MGGTAIEPVRGSCFNLYRDQGVLRIDWDADAEVGGPEAEEAMAAIAALTGGAPVPILVDMRAMRGLDRDARQVFAHSELTPRAALCVATPLSRTMASFFITVGHPGFDARVFTDVDEARGWLLHDS